MSGADPGFFLAGGGALVSCSTSTPINYIVFFLFGQNTVPVVLENRRSSWEGGGGGGVAQPLHPPPRSAPVCRCQYLTTVFVISLVAVAVLTHLRHRCLWPFGLFYVAVLQAKCCDGI